MGELNNIISVGVTDEMKQRAKEAKKDGYSGEAEYVRDMWLAGESTVGTLDPRTSGITSADINAEIDNAEAAAKALDDVVLLNALSTDDPKPLDDAVESIVQEFENVIANRIIELRDDDQSAVADDGRGNYYLER